ncbi:hypothetical protein [Microcoleus sp. PH2017_09_SFU_O_A]|uniref:hypothetical protein n=1 Tax=Microcoleus sp. PH2017_09_SFU_O_A TaxID=2798820 RepID=UPI0025E9F1E2|nr:hypothetical protein [Microcoleus sp. PH2017_09_SFU_O_A]
MPQIITAKLKLNLNAEQKALVSQIALAYRDALNYTSQVAFDTGKTSNGLKLQKAVYNELRVRFGLGAQMACNVPRQVSGTYKTLWTKVKQSNDAIAKGYTKRRYKGLDKPPKYIKPNSK